MDGARGGKQPPGLRELFEDVVWLPTTEGSHIVSEEHGGWGPAKASRSSDCWRAAEKDAANRNHHSLRSARAGSQFSRGLDMCGWSRFARASKQACEKSNFDDAVQVAPSESVAFPCQIAQGCGAREICGVVLVAWAALRSPARDGVWRVPAG